MGLFDMIFVDCPECGEPNEFQTKGMPNPYMNRLRTDAVPLMAAAYIVTDDSEKIPDDPYLIVCEGCETPLELTWEPPLPATVAFRLVKAGRKPS